MPGILKLPISFLRPIYEQTSLHRDVIEEVEDERLRNAYATCRQITRKHAKTFYMATRFLPNHKQRSIFAIYALCRFLDDIVDEMEDLITQKIIDKKYVHDQIDDCKTKLEGTYQGHYYENPIYIAFADVLRQYDIPIEWPFELMEGVSMDLTKNRYQTFDDLYDYSYKVASIVGLITSEVFGYTTDEARQHAIDLGIAMQLTNILRDVGEDLEKDRIYLPREELENFGVTEQDLFNHNKTDGFVALMQFQIDRARDYYRSADKGIPLLDKDSRIPVYLARYNYARILDEIENNRYNVFDQRAYVSKLQKLSVIPKIWMNVA